MEQHFKLVGLVGLGASALVLALALAGQTLAAFALPLLVLIAAGVWVHRQVSSTSEAAAEIIATDRQREAEEAGPAPAGGALAKLRDGQSI